MCSKQNISQTVTANVVPENYWSQPCPSAVHCEVCKIKTRKLVFGKSYINIFRATRVWLSVKGLNLFIAYLATTIYLLTYSPAHDEVPDFGWLHCLNKDSSGPTRKFCDVTTKKQTHTLSIIHRPGFKYDDSSLNADILRIFALLAI